MGAQKVAAFHIGVHKTGTSVVQHYLSEHRRLLRRKRVLWVRRSELGAAIGWGRPLLDDPTPVTGWVQQLRRSRIFLTLVGSYENLVGQPFADGMAGRLYPRAERNLTALAAAMHAVPEVRAKVAVSIRPQADFLESYYLQSIHQGGYENFDQWLAKVDLGALSWRPLVAMLGEAFGPGNVEVVDFRLMATAGQEEFLRHLLTRIDPRLDFPVSYAAERNRSLSGRGLQMALALNPYLETGVERKAARTFLQENFSNVGEARPQLLSADQRADLAGRYAAEYEALVRGPAPGGVG